MRTAEQVQMIADWHRGAIADARAASERLQPLADEVFAPPVSEYRRRLKELLVSDGVISAAHMRSLGTPRTPA